MSTQPVDLRKQGETEQYTLQSSIKAGIYDELVIDFRSMEL